MKLNKSMKEAIIAQIMGDVPQIDYNEECRKLVQAHYKKLLPSAVGKLLTDPKHEKHLRNTDISTPSGLSNVTVRGGFSESHWNSASIDPVISEKVKELADAAKKQNDDRRNLETKLNAAFSRLNTRKQALEAFPEFEKYLPSEDPALKNLPITTDVMPALVNMGWPKNSKTPKSRRAA